MEIKYCRFLSLPTRAGIMYTPIENCGKHGGRCSLMRTLPQREDSPIMQQTDEGSDDEAAADGGHTEDVGPSVCFLISINSFGFAYSLVVATLGVVILPSEAIRLFADNHAMMLGVMLGCTGVTQLIGPAVGYHSDRSTSRYGRRRPLLVVGAVVACCGSLVMLFAHEYQLRYLYVAALTAAIAGMNISYACYTALLPDLVPSSHLGRASGTMATMSMLGALLGFSLFGFLLQTGVRLCRVCLLRRGIV
jgi:MFS family permease